MLRGATPTIYTRWGDPSERLHQKETTPRCTYGGEVDSWKPTPGVSTGKRWLNAPHIRYVHVMHDISALSLYLWSLSTTLSSPTLTTTMNRFLRNRVALCFMPRRCINRLWANKWEILLLAASVYRTTHKKKTEIPYCFHGSFSLQQVIGSSFLFYKKHSSCFLWLRGT